MARLSEKYISILVKTKRNIKLIVLGMTNIKMPKEPKKLMVCLVLKRFSITLNLQH